MIHSRLAGVLALAVTATATATAQTQPSTPTPSAADAHAHARHRRHPEPCHRSADGAQRVQLGRHPGRRRAAGPARRLQLGAVLARAGRAGDAFRPGHDAGRFSFRGLNGEGRVNAVKLLIDGIPSNDNAGGMPFLDAVFPLDIESIEIVRGTNDPRWGLNNIAGNANVVTRSGGNEGRASLTYGSFGTREAQIVKGLRERQLEPELLARLARLRRLSRPCRRHQARAVGQVGLHHQRRPLARQPERAPLPRRGAGGGLPDLRPGPGGAAQLAPRTPPPIAASARRIRSPPSSTARSRLRCRGRRSSTSTATRTGASCASPPPARSRSASTTSRQNGAITALTWRPRVDWAHEFTLEGGFDAQWQHNVAQRYRTVERVRGATIRDWDFDLDTRGAYLQAVIRPVEALKIVPALRVDRIGGDFTDRLAGTASPVNGYGTVRQPKISIAYALAPQASVYGNWGRTFQIGTGIDAYRTQARDLGRRSTTAGRPREVRAAAGARRPGGLLGATRLGRGRARAGR